MRGQTTERREGASEQLTRECVLANRRERRSDDDQLTLSELPLQHHHRYHFLTLCQHVMEWTQEKMHALQQMHITLHNAVAAQPQPQCAVNNTFPYKPVLVVRAMTTATAPAASSSAAASTAAASASAAASSVAAPVSLEIPLSARVDLSSPRTSLALSSDATVISLGMTADLDPAPASDDAAADAFPSARELDPREYEACYCRHCGTTLFAPRPASSPFTLHSLPSAYWSELTDLWFCHTTDNAHMAKLASLQIQVARGKIMVDKMGIRVHCNDLAQPGAWRGSESVVRLTREATAAAVAAAAGAGAAAAAPSSSSSSAVAPREIWSPLPCVGCRAILGSILLTLRPCADPAAAVQVSQSGEVRLLKYQLSNCFRKKTTQSSSAATATGNAVVNSAAGSAMTSGEMEDAAEAEQNPSSSSVAVSAPAAAATSSSSAPSPSPSCLCSSYTAAAPSSTGALRLTCSNLWKSYTFESLVVEDLVARFQKAPANKFVIESIDDEEQTGVAGTAAAATSAAAASTTTGSATSVSSKLFLRILVTHWNLSLSSTLTGSFPFTPSARSSNRMVPVIKLEFGAHDNEGDPKLSKWTGATQNAKVGAAQPIEKIHYSLADCRALLELLQTRSECWPASMQTGTLDSSLRKSCLVKLHAMPDK